MSAVTGCHWQPFYGSNVEKMCPTTLKLHFASRHVEAAEITRSLRESDVITVNINNTPRETESTSDRRSERFFFLHIIRSKKEIS